MRSIFSLGLITCVLGGSLTGCGTFEESQSLVLDQTLSTSIRLPDRVQQNDSWSCGFHNGSRLLSFYGKNMGYYNLRDRHGKYKYRFKFFGKRISIPLDMGHPPPDVRNILNAEAGSAHKFGWSYHQNIDTIEMLVNRGNPVMALIHVRDQNVKKKVRLVIGSKTFRAVFPVLHWITVVGVNKSKQEIYYYGTSSNEIKTYSFSGFMERWNLRGWEGKIRDIPFSSKIDGLNDIHARTIIW